MDGAPVWLYFAVIIRHDFRFGRVRDLENRVVHVFRHAPLVLSQIVADSGNGYSVLTERRSYDRDPIIRLRDRFAKRMQRKHGGIARLHRLFEVEAESGNALRPGEIGLRSRVPELAAKSPDIVTLSAIAMIEARHVHVLASDAIIV